MKEQRAVPVELFFDLVFVFALTQVTQLLADDLGWAGLGRSMLILALIWWSWSAFTWVANAHDPDATGVRVALFVAMIACFIAALTIPGAFGDDAMPFVLAYALVRVIHLGLYADASRRGSASFEAIAGFAMATGIAIVLLIAGALADDPARTWLWAAALVIDLAGPYVTRRRLRNLQEVGVAHFAERFGLFLIITLGESIVATGVGASSAEFDTAQAAGVALSIAVTIGMWWAYFDYVAESAEQRLGSMDDAVSAARDAYSYLHFFMVAGIIIFAVGSKKAIAHVDDPLGTAGRWALCGGVAIYLAGHIAFRLRLLGTLSREKAVAAGACVIVGAATAGAPAYVPAALLALVLFVLVARESVVERELRTRLHAH